MGKKTRFGAILALSALALTACGGNGGTPGGGSASGGRTGRPRTLLAFPSADAALAFAQRNQLAGPAARPRLRQLALLHLLQVLIGEPAIVALLLVSDDAPDDLPPGRLPDGLDTAILELPQEGEQVCGRFGEVAAREPGQGGLPALEPAPGSYVKIES